MDGASQKKSYLVFGATKTGKTLLASTLPSDETLLINTENNLDSLYGANINTVSVQNFKEFEEVLDKIISGAITPNWLFLDSISDLMSKIRTDTFKKFSDGRQAYSEYEMQYNDIVAKFKSLPCNVVAIARQTQVKDEVTGGTIFGAALPWAKIQHDLPFNFSAVLAARSSKGEDGKQYYSLQCHACSQYQVGIRTQFGKVNPFNQFEAPNLLEIHKKLTQP